MHTHKHTQTCAHAHCPLTVCAPAYATPCLAPRRAPGPWRRTACSRSCRPFTATAGPRSPYSSPGAGAYARFECCDLSASLCRNSFTANAYLQVYHLGFDRQSAIGKVSEPAVDCRGLKSHGGSLDYHTILAPLAALSARNCPDGTGPSRYLPPLLLLTHPADPTSHHFVHSQLMPACVLSRIPFMHAATARTR